jgi:hypothetical protein
MEKTTSETKEKREDDIKTDLEETGYEGVHGFL